MPVVMTYILRSVEAVRFKEETDGSGFERINSRMSQQPHLFLNLGKSPTLSRKIFQPILQISENHPEFFDNLHLFCPSLTWMDFIMYFWISASFQPAFLRRFMTSDLTLIGSTWLSCLPPKSGTIPPPNFLRR